MKNDNVERAKKIVATFLKIEPSEVDGNTAIDKRAISGSILIKRM